MKKLTKKEYEILYLLINTHLNLISEQMGIVLKNSVQDNNSYLFEMEKIESKLAEILSTNK